MSMGALESSRESQLEGIERAQRALGAQLESRLDEIKARANDAVRALRAAAREREDVGVELYALQGALARERAAWMSSDAMTHGAREARVDAERETESIAHAAHVAVESLREARERTTARRVELETLARRVKTEDESTTTREADAALTRRVASATSTALDDAERQRLARELRVAYVKDCIDRAKASSANAKFATLDAQNDTARMREQMSACDAALAELNVDMDAVCKRWKATLAAIAKADESLDDVRASEAKVGADARLLDGERQALSEALEDARAQRDAHGIKLNKLDGEIDVANALIVSLKAAIDDKKAQSAEVLSAAKNHDGDTHKEGKRENEIENEIEKVDQAYVAYTRELHEVEEQALLHVAEKMTTNKLAQKLARGTREFREKTRAASDAVVITKNEIAKKKVDVVKSLAAEANLRERMVDVEARVQVQRSDIDGCEAEISQNVDEIEKTSSKIDKLNKKLETLRDISPEHVGPLEAQIAHLKNEINELERQSHRLREQWLRSQTVILANNDRTRQAIATVNELEEVNAVLVGKRNRHERNASKFNAERDAAKKEWARERLNLRAVDEKIARTESEHLLHAVKAMEAEDLRWREIDALSAENAKLGAEIRTRTDAMHVANADSDRCARLIADMERKIELEQRAQVALDPTRGNTEVAMARKENAKLALALHRLNTKRESIASKIEACVKRRELIIAKGDALQAKIEADGEEVREAEVVAAAKRARSDICRRLHDTRKAAEEIEPKIQALEIECGNTRDAHSRVSAMTDELSARREFLRVDADVRLRDAYELALLNTSSHQKIASRFTKLCELGAVRDDDQHNSSVNHEKCDEALKRLQRKRDDMRKALRDEISRNPQAMSELKRAQSYLTAAVPH